MNNLVLRTVALLLHALLNFFVISYTMDYDITGRWLNIILFVLLCIVLMYFFVLHIISFYQFVKSK